MKRAQAADVGFDFDALMQRESSTPTRAEYLEKLARERTYLEGEIAKLSGKSGGRQNAIRAELMQALSESCAARDAILKGDWFAVLQIRDQMHIRLHSTKHFQWAPDLQRGSKFKRTPGSRNAKSIAIAAYVEALIRANPEATRTKLYGLADRNAIDEPNDLMSFDTFKRYVTEARRSLGMTSLPGRPRR